MIAPLKWLRRSRAYGLSLRAQALAAALVMRADNNTAMCSCTQKELASDMHCDRSTVAKLMAELVEKRLVRQLGTRQRRCYQLTSPDEIQTECFEALQAFLVWGAQCAEGAHSVCPDSTLSVPREHTQANPSVPREHTQCAQTAHSVSAVGTPQHCTRFFSSSLVLETRAREEEPPLPPNRPTGCKWPHKGKRDPLPKDQRVEGHLIQQALGQLGVSGVTLEEVRYIRAYWTRDELRQVTRIAKTTEAKYRAHTFRTGLTEIAIPATPKPQARGQPKTRGLPVHTYTDDDLDDLPFV